MMIDGFESALGLAYALRRGAVGSIATLAIVLSSCTGTTEDAAPVTSASVDAWEAFRITGDEAEFFPSLVAMKREADLVIAGTLVPSGATRTVQGDAPEDVVEYTVGSLQVDDVLAGSTGKQTLTVEFLGDEVLPTARTLIFLRHKGGDEAGKYRAVNSNGLWTATPRSEVDAPLAEAPPETGGPLSDDLRTAGIESLDELIAHVREIGDH